jgi:heterodisulfide reductase subunit A-like polyferredoxin
MQSGKILLSTDPLALDISAASMAGLKLQDVPILLTASRRNLGETNAGNIEIAGDYKSPPLLPKFKLPRRHRSTKRMNYNALVKVIDFFKTHPSINLKVCRGCNVCVESCPVEAIDRDTKKIDYSKCIGCMCCHELCMHKAVRLKNDKFIAGIITSLYKR